MDCYVSRSGYTGEDGFEISVPAQRSRGPGPSAAGPSLRSRPLAWVPGTRCALRPACAFIGHDVNEQTTPIEADCSGPSPEPRRLEGARAGGFPGADRILPATRWGQPQTRGAAAARRTPVRERARNCAMSEARSSALFAAVAFGPSSVGLWRWAIWITAYIALRLLTFWAIVHAKRLAYACKQNAFASTTLLSVVNWMFLIS